MVNFSPITWAIILNVNGIDTVVKRRHQVTLKKEEPARLHWLENTILNTKASLSKK
jgi:hypothetical protein